MPNRRMILALGPATLAFGVAAAAQTNPTIDSWGRYQYPAFGISLEVPDGFPGPGGRTSKRPPVPVKPMSDDFLRLSSFDSSGDRTGRSSEFDIELRRSPKGGAAPIIGKCGTDKKRISEIPGAWWCQLNPAWNVGDSQQTHLAQIPTPRGEVSVYVFGLWIGEEAAERILKSIRLAPVAPNNKGSPRQRRTE